MANNVLKTGIIGLGRSGRGIHGNQLVRLPECYQIRAAADGIAERQQRAVEEYNCNVYNTWQEMVEQEEELDLIVNASPSHMHFPITLELLNRGFNVLCEKPLAKTADEVDQLIAAAKRNGKVLAVFQQSRYQQAFVQIQKVIESGVLGNIVQINFTLNGFARRWDWQTLQSNNGGNLMNTGPHPLDQALQLFGGEDMPDLTCMMNTVNTFGDAEDYVKLIMRGENRPIIDLEISSCCTYGRETFNIQGSNGGLKGTATELEWKYFKSEEAPLQQLVREPITNSDGMPAYCQETLEWHEDSWKLELTNGLNQFEDMVNTFYEMLYRHMADGAPLEITPEQVRRQMLVMEECRKQNPHIYKPEPVH